MVLCWIVLIVIHAQHHRNVFVLGGGGDDHFFHRPALMLSRVGGVGEQSCGLNHDFRTDRRPVDLGGIFRLEHAKTLAVHGNGIVCVGDLLMEIAEDGIVL